MTTSGLGMLTTDTDTPVVTITTVSTRLEENQKQVHFEEKKERRSGNPLAETTPQRFPLCDSLKTKNIPHLLQVVDILTEGSLKVVGDNLLVLTSVDILLSVEEPLRNVVGKRVVDDSNDLIDFFRSKFTSTREKKRSMGSVQGEDSSPHVDHRRASTRPRRGCRAAEDQDIEGEHTASLNRLQPF